jgi:hypothetical protein
MASSSAFEGVAYRTAVNWLPHIPLAEFAGRPINYLEIGVFYGANLLSVCDTYAKHPGSRAFAVDPWADYDEYSEYRGQQDSAYAAFRRNLERSGHLEKVRVLRGYSHAVVPALEDGLFDIVYIDGNHEPEYVVEDAVLAFRKLKAGGYMIFDDFGWGGPDLTQRGIEAFCHAFHKRIQHVALHDSQMILKKL